MSPLICIPAVAVILVLTLWAVLRSRVSFEHFPLPDYRKELEFGVFFLPGGLAGWFSIHVAYSYLSNETNVFNLAWSLGLIVAFVIWEFLGLLSLAQGGDLIKAVYDAEWSDFIAMGVGYAVGIFLGSYDIIVHQPQPPPIVFSLGEDAIVVILLILGAIALANIDAYLLPFLRKRRKKAKRLKDSTSRKKQLAPPEIKLADELPSTSENKLDVDENPSG